MTRGDNRVWYQNLMGNYPIVKKIVEEFEGKEIYTCHTSGIDGRRVNFDMTNVTFCHEGEIKNAPSIVHNMCAVEEFSLEKYYESVYEIMKQFQDPDCPCRKCSHCMKQTFHFKPIRLVIISPSNYCNSSCIYCYCHFAPKNSGYNSIPYIKELGEASVLESGCLFDWGGGEPTQNKFFEETVEYISKQGFRQRINTNAIEFSQKTYEALRKGNVNVRVSVDSGTKEVFYIMKGHKKYEEVWDNIRKYSSISTDVDVKYNVCNYNSDVPELEAFLLKCRECGVRNIHIDAEFNSYQKEKNCGPFYFTEKELDAAKYLERRAKEMGFHVVISGYAFGTRAEYVNGELVLPKKYYDNIDRDVITNEVFVRTFSSVEGMLENLRAYEKCVIFGAGKMGNELAEILNNNNICYEIIDNNASLIGKNIHGITIRETSVILDKEYSDIPVILAAGAWMSMLKQMNEEFLHIKNVYWMHELYYLKELEDKANENEKEKQ